MADDAVVFIILINNAHMKYQEISKRRVLSLSHSG